MNHTILKVNKVGKQYRLGEVGTGTLSHDLNRWWAKLRGKPDPFLTIGESNDRTKSGNSEYVWALRNISFEVKQGEVLGIIGKNGAGKSTLLKLLSKVTGPTTGEILYNGRIAALLEVGTGFHPELTGRENVFLNGAILGMTKSEIRAKFDEIVEFSGVERYIDTPVKRYSSGMLVRLGFAVAAHLEPEILIVDEVLAVGDIEFQKKCLGKMDEVSKSGRTVLFVSHNMNAVRNLCTRCIVIDNGEVDFEGDTLAAISRYIELSSGNTFSEINNLSLSSESIKLTNFEIFVNGKVGHQAQLCDTIKIKFDYCILTEISDKNLNVAFRIVDDEDRDIANEELLDSGSLLKTKVANGNIEITLNDIRLYPGRYKIKFFVGTLDWMSYYLKSDSFVAFEVVESSDILQRPMSKRNGLFYLKPNWQIL